MTPPVTATLTETTEPVEIWKATRLPAATATVSTVSWLQPVPTTEVERGVAAKAPLQTVEMKTVTVVVPMPVETSM